MSDNFRDWAATIIVIFLTFVLLGTTFKVVYPVAEKISNAIELTKAKDEETTVSVIGDNSFSVSGDNNNVVVNYNVTQVKEVDTGFTISPMQQVFVYIGYSMPVILIVIFIYRWYRKYKNNLLQI